MKNLFCKNILISRILLLKKKEDGSEYLEFTCADGYELSDEYLSNFINNKINCDTDDNKLFDK